MARRYELKARAVAFEATRQRIVDAALALHEEVGPARTAITEVSRRAGVGRVTVYNHFPDEAALLSATSAQWLAEHPPPDPERWAGIFKPARRIREALDELYPYYRANASMLGHLTRDVAVVPALAETFGEALAEHEQAMRDALVEGRARRGRRTVAAIGLAISFATWQRLTRDEGLGDDGAAKLMVRAIEAP
jgi:AcrR family transcriptional regulator